MNATEEFGTRQQQNGALKQRFASLTEDDQLYQEGQQQEEFGKLQVRLGQTAEELNKIIKTL